MNSGMTVIGALILESSSLNEARAMNSGMTKLEIIHAVVDDRFDEARAMNSGMTPGSRDRPEEQAASMRPER